MHAHNIWIAMMLPARKSLLAWCLLFPSLALVIVLWRWGKLRILRRLTITSSGTVANSGHSAESVGRELFNKRLRKNVEVELAVPEAVVGYLIGRRGNRIRQIEEDSGAKLRLKERIGTRDKLLAISGSPECVQSAQESVHSVIDQKLSEKKNQREIQLLIPEFAVGKLIGRRGINIRSIQRQSGAKVSIEDGGGTGNDRLCLVSGSSKQIEEALVLIEASVQIKCSERNGLRQGQFSEKVHLLPATLPDTRDYFSSFVSAVDGEGGVWVQPIEREDPAVLEKLVDDMTLAYSQLSAEDSKLDNAAAVCVCAAPFEADSRWYRAMITSTPNEGVANVLYLDYGDSSLMSISELKTLRPEFFSVRCQAVRCVLDSIMPTSDGWNEDGLTLLEDLTYCASWKPVMVKVVDATVHSITIVDTNTEKDIDVADQLVKNGLAKWVDHIKLPHPPFPITVSCPSLLHGKSYSSIAQVSLPNGHFPAYVMAVDSLELFYIMPTAYKQQFAGLMENINSVYSASGEPSSNSVAITESQVVAVCGSDPPTWFRAVLISATQTQDQPQDEMVLAHLLDYGVNISLPLTSVRPLREEFCQVPSFAVSCSLADITIPGNGCSILLASLAQQLAEWTKPGNWENQVIVQASPKGEGHLAVLFLPGGEVTVNEQLAKRAKLDLTEGDQEIDFKHVSIILKARVPSSDISWGTKQSHFIK